jgi:hypothetical protein
VSTTSAADWSKILATLRLQDTQDTWMRVDAWILCRNLETKDIVKSQMCTYSVVLEEIHSLLRSHIFVWCLSSVGLYAAVQCTGTLSTFCSRNLL